MKLYFYTSGKIKQQRIKEGNVTHFFYTFSFTNVFSPISPIMTLSSVIILDVWSLPHMLTLWMSVLFSHDLCKIVGG